jgi:hypothetical protein
MPVDLCVSPTKPMEAFYFQQFQDSLNGEVLGARQSQRLDLLRGELEDELNDRADQIQMLDHIELLQTGALSMLDGLVRRMDDKLAN